MYAIIVSRIKWPKQVEMVSWDARLCDPYSIQNLLYQSSLFQAAERTQVAPKLEDDESEAEVEPPGNVVSDKSQTYILLFQNEQPTIPNHNLINMAK